MERQPKVLPHRPARFFSDGQSARPPVPGTIARGRLQDDDLLYTGKENGRDATVFPFPVTRAVLDRGRERYEIYCAACHDRLGTGNGMVVQRGFPKPVSFHSEHARQEPAGHYFDVITHGYGRMYSYEDKITAPDRWAIVAYIRALQLSQNARLTDIPEQERKAFAP